MLFSHIALAGGVFLIPGLAIQTAVRLGRDFFAGQNTIKNGVFFVIGTGHFHKTCFINPKLKYTTNENTLKMIDQGPKTLSVFRSEEHTSELQSRPHLVCRLLLEKKKKKKKKKKN